MCHPPYGIVAVILIDGGKVDLVAWTLTDGWGDRFRRRKGNNPAQYLTEQPPRAPTLDANVGRVGPVSNRRQFVHGTRS